MAITAHPSVSECIWFRFKNSHWVTGFGHPDQKSDETNLPPLSPWKGRADSMVPCRYPGIERVVDSKLHQNLLGHKVFDPIHRLLEVLQRVGIGKADVAFPKCTELGPRQAGHKGLIQ